MLGSAVGVAASESESVSSGSEPSAIVLVSGGRWIARFAFL